jgi:hypothetical protein
MEAAQHAVEEARLELRHEREARQRVERTLQEVLGQLALERGAKEAAERAATEANERLADVRSESNGIAERAKHEKSSKEVVERRSSSAGADFSEAIRTRRICSNILSEPAGIGRALPEGIEKVEGVAKPGRLASGRRSSPGLILCPVEPRSVPACLPRLSSRRSRYQHGLPVMIPFERAATSIAILAFAVTLSSSAASEQRQPDDTIVAQFELSARDMVEEEVAESYGLELIDQSTLRSLGVRIARYRLPTVGTVLERLRADRRIVSAALNVRYAPYPPPPAELDMTAKQTPWDERRSASSKREDKPASQSASSQDKPATTASRPPRRGDKVAQALAEDWYEARRMRRMCNAILSDPGGYDQALLEICQNVVR